MTSICRTALSVDSSCKKAAIIPGHSTLRPYSMHSPHTLQCCALPVDEVAKSITWSHIPMANRRRGDFDGCRCPMARNSQVCVSAQWMAHHPSDTKYRRGFGGTGSPEKRGVAGRRLSPAEGVAAYRARRGGASSSSAASLWSVTYEVRSLPRLPASWNLHPFDAATLPSGIRRGR